jgi:hypothetical protein
MIKIKDEQINEVLTKLILFSVNELCVNVNVNSNRTCCFINDKKILIQNKQKPITKCYSLLHELGHILQPVSFYCIDKKSKKICKSLIIQQEINAWEVGWLIAKYLEIDNILDYDNYVKESSKFINLYLESVNRLTLKSLKIESTVYKSGDNQQLQEWLTIYDKIKA